MKLAEFFISLVVDAESGELTIKRLIASIGDLEAITVGQIGAFFELANGIAEITDEHLKYALSLEKASQETDVGTDALQRWLHVAKSTEIPGMAESMQSALGVAAKMVHDWRLGLMPPPGQNPLLRYFAIRADDPAIKNAGDLVLKIREKIQKGIFVGGKRLEGFDLHEVLNEVGTQFAAIQPILEKMSDVQLKLEYEHTPITTPEDIKAAKQLAHEFDQIHDLVWQVGTLISEWVAPAVIGYLEDVKVVLGTIKDLKNESPTARRKTLETIMGLKDEGQGMTLKQEGDWLAKYATSHLSAMVPSAPFTGPIQVQVSGAAVVHFKPDEAAHAAFTLKHVKKHENDQNQIHAVQTGNSLP